MAAILTLDRYLSTSMARPFVWGRADCCTFAADWIVSAMGLDPAECVRGLYSSEAEAHEIIAERGGLAKLVGEEMDRLGFARTDEPISGDVGLVVMPWVGMTAAIMFGGRWMFRRACGLIGVPAKAAIAWRIPHHA